MIEVIITLAEWFILFCLVVVSAYLAGWITLHIFKSIHRIIKGE